MTHYHIKAIKIYVIKHIKIVTFLLLGNPADLDQNYSRLSLTNLKIEIQTFKNIVELKYLFFSVYNLNLWKPEHINVYYIKEDIFMITFSQSVYF